jgi:dihydropteroate synthase
MGVVNATPDSFSDGGRYLDPHAAVAHARVLIGEGADILDVGGESTRPGARPVPEKEELRRVLPVLEGIAQAGCEAQVSIDTTKAAVARAALGLGASIVNDVSALRGDPQMAEVVAESGCECVLMHMLGEPGTMQADPRYGEVVDEVRAFLEQRMEDAVRAGISEQRIMLDPGIGFGKTIAHNLALLSRLHELSSLGRPLVVGTSRKSFIGRIVADAAGQSEPAPIARRLPGTIATSVLAYERGARVLRVHDVAPVRAALAVADATLNPRWTPASRIPTSWRATQRS